MKNKGKMICKVNSLAVLMEDHGQGPIFIVAVVNEAGDVLESTVLDLSLTVFLQRCLDAAISEVLNHAVKEEWYGKNDSDAGEEQTN